MRCGRCAAGGIGPPSLATVHPGMNHFPRRQLRATPGRC
jgi:hypothetical protein